MLKKSYIGEPQQLCYAECMDAKTQKITISVPANLSQFVAQEVKAKGYGNVSEYFRELLREAQMRQEEARIDALLLESLDSPQESILNTEELWQELRSSLKERILIQKANS